MDTISEIDCLIVGADVSGITASIYMAKRGFNVHLFERGEGIFLLKYS